MTKYEITYTETAKKHLQAIKRGDNEYVKKIIQKIEFCLGEHLLTSIKQCNKKKLKGKENTHRLHIQRKYTVFYKVMKAEQKTSVEIHEVMGFEAAHKKYSHVDL
ncbi:type II toxin-antitoxin system RelE family toxin [Methanofollis ethanolicus]|uniref:type II toxin-antitoxin system RelE family toxin n=1 Tax=Methanofollis ethanolicus TaxID=488124 RepID=UPI000832004B|nr:type II toxin-antitoxin system mRNA interferase toxin, RelE/StbE family [Methanofollis ethanolicus]